MSIGSDLKNQTEILKKKLDKISYPLQITFKTLQDENPMIFLQILHYAVIEFNPEYYKSMIDKGYELFSKSDMKFMESIYKFVQTEYGFKPSILIKNFFTNVFLEQKLIFVNSVIDFVLKATLSIQKKQVQKKPKSIDNDKQQMTNSTQKHLSKKEDASNQVRVVRCADEDEEGDDNEEEEEKPRKIDFYKMSQLDENIQVNNESREGIKRIQRQTLQQQENIQHVEEEFRKMQSESSKMKRGMEEMSNVLQKNDLISCKYSKIEPDRRDIKQNQDTGNTQTDEQLSQIRKQRDIDNYDEQQTIQNKNKNALDRTVTVRELNEVMKLIVAMNSSIQQTISKLDSFQSSVNSSLINIKARFQLLECDVNILKAKEETGRSLDDQKQ